MAQTDPPHGAAVQEIRERQRNEITLLESMYPEELRMTRDPQSLEEDIEFEMHLDAAHALSFVLPHATYPASSGPVAFLSFSSDVPNQARKHLRARLREIIDRQEPGTECVDLVTADFKQALEDLRSAQEACPAHSTLEPQTAKAAEERGLRVVLWMHHLLATSKRRAIVQLSKELGLAGYSKPGYPGAVYVEGEAGNVRTFVDELKSMRWQAIQERAAESTPLPSLTLLSTGSAGIAEVQGLGEIAEALKSHGEGGPDIARFFLGSMKIK